MQDCHHVYDQRGRLLVDQPVVKSGIMNTGLIEEVEVQEPWDLMRLAQQVYLQWFRHAQLQSAAIHLETLLQLIIFRGKGGDTPL